MVNRRRWATVCVAGVLSVSTQVLGRGAGDSEQANPAPPESAPFRPQLGGGMVDGGSTVADRVASLEALASEALDSVSKAAARLAAANVILTEAMEPVCTDRFLEIDRGQAEAVLAGGPLSLEKADSLIAAAREALDTPPGDTPAEGTDTTARSAELLRNADVLEAFSGAIRTYLGLNGEADPARAGRRAASRLAPALEDADPRVAASAAFWQACLRSLDPDPDAALEVLDLATAPPTPDGLRYGFFSRLLRCRLLAAKKAEPLALSFLLQMEERTNDWFKAEPERREAFRTVGWVQMQVVRHWHDRLSPTEQAAERAWCVDRIQHIRDEVFAEPEKDTVMRLVEAVPLIVRPPSGDTPTPSPTPAP